jgi:energy-coupling factor transport system ATP-binding protein
MTSIAGFCQFSYWYPDSSRPALDQLTLELEEGMTLLEGESGSGKSTLLRCLNGLVPHFYGGRAGGTAVVLGRDLRRQSPRSLADRVAVVFQEPETQMVMPIVEQEVAFGPANLGLPAPSVRARVQTALAAMEVSHLAGRPVAGISGGERQRVAIAGALAMAPRLLILDEPTSQLDALGAIALTKALEALEGQGVAVLVAEHRAKRLPSARARRVALAKGRLSSSPAPVTWPSRAARSANFGEVAWSSDQLAVGHGDPVLEDISLSCRSGEVVAVTGPNGSGKTTLLRTLAGLIRPISGRVERRPGRSAYLPQDPGALLHQPTVLREVTQTARWLHLAADPEAMLEQFGIADLAMCDPRDLSTGQRQRVALAAILIGEPEMVFLDEPTRGADQASRRRLLTSIDHLANLGCAVMVATSDEEFAWQVGDSTLVAEERHLTVAARKRP